MKQHVKAICAGIGCTLASYAGVWGVGPLLNDKAFIGIFLLCVLLAVMMPLYFFLRNHMERHWTLRGTIALSSVLLFCFTWVVSYWLADRWSGDLIFPHVCFLGSVHMGLLLLDLLREAFRLLVHDTQKSVRPAWLSRIGPNGKSVVAAFLYLLFFYASQLIYDVAPLFDYSFCLYVGMMSLAYFFVRKHIERRWPFRGIVLLLPLFFNSVLDRVIPLGEELSKALNNSVLISTFIIMAFLLLDFFAGLLQGVYCLVVRRQVTADEKARVRAICAGIGYTFAFRALSWGLGILSERRLLSDTLSRALTVVLFIAMLLTYLFVLNHVQKRWNFRGSVLFFVVLFHIWFLMIGRFQSGGEALNNALFSYSWVIVMGVTFLADVFIELFHYIRRRMRNRTHKNDPPRQILP